uniref:Retrotransposon gag domain-containing protein n=1 Tax=Nymphaea colorata TaxID=210225 RepID=A0A5K1BG64_9MAGN
MGTSQGQEDLTEMVNKLATDVTTHEEALGNAAESFGEMKDEMKVLREQVANLVAMNRALTDTVTALQTEVKELQVKNRTLQRQISVGGGDDLPTRVDVQRPAKYNGTLDSRLIDNFLFQVEYYLDLQGVMGDDLQVKTVVMLLEGDAVAWWKRKRLDIQKGICTIHTFDDFQRELRTYFMPPNATRHAYWMVGELKHTGSLRDYVRVYQWVMLDMPDMQEQDKLNWFILGLQSLVQSEVGRSIPETLEDAYVVAERLVDTQCKSYTNAFKPSKKPDHGGKKEDRRERKDEPSTQRQVKRRTFFRRNDNSQIRVLKCWFCDGNHLGR